MHRGGGLVSVLGVLGVVLSGCEPITGPGLPEGAQRMEPPPVYAEWWRMTEQCSALGGDFEEIAWYVVPEAFELSSGHQGLWQSNGTIIIAGHFVRDGHLVRHEMLHAMRKHGGHPRGDFVGRCGGVVSCEGPCLTAGAAPPADRNALVVDPTHLEIAVSVSASSVSASDAEGYFRLVVTAHNPGSRAVVVRLPPFSDAGPSVSFSYKKVTSGGASWLDERAWAPEVTRFAPGEVKRHVFDFWANGAVPWQERMEPGTYELHGAYGRRWAATPARVTVTR